MSDRDYLHTIHRFWAGRDMPDEYTIFGQMWQEMNPEWQVIDWDMGCIADFPELLPVFQSLKDRDAGRNGIEYYVQLADVLGYALVERWGGVYVNCDMQPIRPFPDMPQKAWASYENTSDWSIVNSAIGAPEPHNPFWTQLLKELPERYFANPTDEMVKTTGPSLLTDQARKNPDQIHVYPVEAFNPVHWRDVDLGGDASMYVEEANFHSGTIAVHHWGHKKDGRTNFVETGTQ
jgi:mannosyltransferase OCH1-like enzyme